MEPQESTAEPKSKTAGASVTPAEHAELVFAAGAIGRPLSDLLREFSINDLLQKAADFRRRLAA